MSDPMRDLLDRLAQDASRGHLADPSSVRRRGERRTRHQIAASVTVGVAVVVAVAVLAPGGVRELTDRRSAPPAVSPSVEPTVGSSPSSSAGRPERAVSLLSAADLPGPYGGTWHAEPSLEGSAVGACLKGPGFPVAQHQRWYATKANPAKGDEAAFNGLVDLSSAAAAHQALVSAEASLAGCWGFTTNTRALHVGDESLIVYGGIPDGQVDATSMQAVLLARVGPELGIFAVAMDGNGDIPYATELEAKTPEKLVHMLTVNRPGTLPAAPPSETPTPHSAASAYALYTLDPSEVPGPLSGSWSSLTSDNAHHVDSCLSAITTPTQAAAATVWFATTTQPTADSEVAVNQVVDVGTSEAAHAALLEALDTADRCWGGLAATTASEGDESFVLVGDVEGSNSPARHHSTVVLVRVGSYLGIFGTAVRYDIGDVSYASSVKAHMPGRLADLLTEDGAKSDSP